MKRRPRFFSEGTASEITATRSVRSRTREIVSLEIIGCRTEVPQSSAEDLSHADPRRSSRASGGKVVEVARAPAALVRFLTGAPRPCALLPLPLRGLAPCGAA